MEKKFAFVRETVDNRIVGNNLQVEEINRITAPPFQYFFRVDMRLLRLIGLSTFSNISTADTPSARWWHDAYMFFGVLTINFSICCLMYRIVYAENELTPVLETISVLCSAALCMLKGLRWWTHRQLLHKSLQQLSILWEIARSYHFLTPENLETADKVKLLRSIYTVTMVSLSSSYVIRPYIILLDYQFRHYPNDSFHQTFILSEEYGFTFGSFWKYFAFITYEQMAVFFTCIYWISSDTLFAQLVTHISIQFNILANRLENVGDGDTGHTNIINQRLRDIAKQHHQLYTYCHSIEILYNPIIFSTILSNGINACCCLFVMEEQFSARNWNEITKSILHLIVLSIQTVIYCGYTDSLIQSSSRMAHAANSARWIDFNKRNKTTLLIIMMRAHKEYEYTVYGLMSLNLNRLTMMANGAISYFMLLRNFG